MNCNGLNLHNITRRKQKRGIEYVLRRRHRQNSGIDKQNSLAKFVRSQGNVSFVHRTRVAHESGVDYEVRVENQGGVTDLALRMGHLIELNRGIP